MDENQQVVAIPYTQEEVNEIKSFSIAKQKIELLLDVLESTREVEMPTLALESKIIDKIDDLLDSI